MASLRDIKKRIKSVNNTQKVTHAMELVAAAKMRKAQVLALAGRPYSTSLHEILNYVQPKAKTFAHKLLTENKSAGHLIIIVSSDRGLAGGLNINIFREILRAELKGAKYIAVGKKARDFVVKTKNELVATYESDEKTSLEMARLITKMASDAYIKGEVGKVSIIYPHFESTIKQTPRWVQVLPIPPFTQTEEKPVENDVLMEPSADKILEFLLSHHILTQIYQVLVEAKAPEHSARMVAMKNATDAAQDLSEDLTLTYNQARQEAITTELLDIVTAQKAFE